MALPSFSLQLKVSLPAFALGLLVFFVSFSVNFWASGSYKDVDFHGGLWRVCFSKSNFQRCVTWSDDVAKYLAKDWMHKTQALECLALILLIAAFGSLAVHFFSKMKLALIAAVVSCFLAATFMIAGCAAFASDLHNDDVWSLVGRLGWAFGFNIVAAISTAVAGVGLLLLAIFGPAQVTRNPPTNIQSIPTVA